MNPTEFNIRCFHCGSRRIRIRTGHMRPVEDPVFCNRCDTYLGRRSDVAFERRRLITGAANEPFNAPSRAFPLHERVTLTVINDDSFTPSVAPTADGNTPRK